MTHLRRSLVVLVTTVALALGLTGTAWATFSATTARPTLGVSTATLAVPTDVTARTTSCNNGRWIDVAVSWTASSSKRITGYTVTAHRGDGQVSTVATTDAATTRVTTTVDKLAKGSTSVRFTVTATLANWTAESPESGVVSC